MLVCDYTVDPLSCVTHRFGQLIKRFNCLALRSRLGNPRLLTRSTAMVVCGAWADDSAGQLTLNCVCPTQHRTGEEMTSRSGAS